MVRRATLGNTVPPLLGQRHAHPVQTPMQNQQRHKGNMPKATGRVYAMSRAEAARSGNLVMGHCVIGGNDCCVLYDAGVTHSFVSNACVKKFGLPCVSCNVNLWYLLRRRVWSGHRPYALGVRWR